MASVAQPALRGSRDWAYSVQKWNARRVTSTSVLMPISSRFSLSQAIGWALTWSFYTAPPDFAKRNAFKHAFANKQWLDDFVGDLRVTFSISLSPRYEGPRQLESWFLTTWYISKVGSAYSGKLTRKSGSSLHISMSSFWNLELESWPPGWKSLFWYIPVYTGIYRYILVYTVKQDFILGMRRWSMMNGFTFSPVAHDAM